MGGIDLHKRCTRDTNFYNINIRGIFKILAQDK